MKKKWMDKFAQYGLLGFTEYDSSYDDDLKSAATSAPYY